MKCLVCNGIAGFNYPYYPIQYQKIRNSKWLDSGMVLCDNGCDESFGNPRFKLWIESERNNFNLLMENAK